MRSVPDSPSSANLSLATLRDQLIDLTVALADELAADGDVDRLEALTALYRTTQAALKDRELRVVR